MDFIPAGYYNFPICLTHDKRLKVLKKSFFTTMPERVSPKNGPYNPNYLRIHFNKKENAPISYQEEVYARGLMKEVFSEILLWIEKEDACKFWILIRDIDHEKSWHRIK